VLFTGAGFSTLAKDRSGNHLPSSLELRELLWRLCFSEPFDGASTLGELYQVALSRQRGELEKLLATRLSVDPDRLPDFYRLYADFPWHLWYTLNIDDLPEAAGRRFAPTRPIKVISAAVTASGQSLPDSNLEVVALNGTVHDPAESLTFSESQYAERISRQEPLYARCVADITARPVVFIGTELREVPLWQHIELRKQRHQGRDPRPTGILVTPELSLARREVLDTLRIEWLPGTAESFAADVLGPLHGDASAGFAFISRSLGRTGLVSIPLASQLSAERPALETEYLLGEEPHWSDILTGRAIEREDDLGLLAQAWTILNGEKLHTALALTGTAGTGKSTALMRLALRLSNQGIPVLWIARDSQASPPQIRARVREHDSPVALAIDDADLYGTSLVSLLRDLVADGKRILVVFAVRAAKLDEISQRLSSSHDVDLLEHPVPNLTDGDINALISTLDRHNRLGILKGKSQVERRQAFREKAGRQLLVAMIEATSGERFEQKVFDELTGLAGEQRYVYSCVCLASSLRHFLLKEEVQLASGDASGEALVALERLLARHMVSAPPPDYHYFARHRVIADLVVTKLGELRELAEVIDGLAFAAAAKVNGLQNRRDRNWRFLARLINHEYLRQVIGVMEARKIYAGLENILSFDYHYWLQRGSLEVQAGDVRLAENFLSQARSLAPDDYRVETAFAYMQIRKAGDTPHAPESRTLMQTAVDSLESVISMRGDQDPYPFHVLGSQGLAWARRARNQMTGEETRLFLGRLLSAVQSGIKKHPLERDLKQLASDLEKEILMTAVPSPNRAIGRP
jgi:Mrp family chromosome partitioning ATPase